VVGGGVAGTAAAMAASRSGADVTLLEGSDHLPPNRSLFPYLLSGRCSEDDLYRLDPRGLSKESGTDVRLRQRIGRVDLGARLVQSGDLELSFDSLVIASGSEYTQDLPKGFSKKDAFVMKGADDYLSLYKSAGHLSHIALVGPAPLALVAASELSSKVKVSAFLGRAGMRRFSAGAGRRIVEAARARKVAVLETMVEAVAGIKHVEAVLSEGSVIACNAAAVFPNSRPSMPEVDCVRGSHGGLVVDGSMRTSARGVLAAGDCSELRLGVGSFQFRLHSSALVMGGTAGKNAAGASTRAGVSGVVALELFGMEVCTAGLAEADANSLGLDVKEVESEERVKDDPFGEETSCISIVFERRTHRVHGIQAVGAGAISRSEYISAVVSGHATLEELVQQESAYLPHFNRDVSPIRLTAAKALAGR
jgi:NADH oxidase (H2O2-forming)